MKKEDDRGFIERLMSGDVEGGMAAMGGLKAFLNKPKETAATQNEINRTQYSPWLKTGPGDMSKVKTQSVMDNVVSGLMAEQIKKDKDKQNKAFIDAISYKTPNRAPASVKMETSTLDEVEQNENPYHPNLVRSKSAGVVDDIIAKKMDSVLGNQQPFTPVGAPNSNKLGEMFTNPDAFNFTNEETRDQNSYLAEKARREQKANLLSDSRWSKR